jgi:hypothetical protein
MSETPQNEVVGEWLGYTCSFCSNTFFVADVPEGEACYCCFCGCKFESLEIKEDEEDPNTSSAND